MSEKLYRLKDEVKKWFKPHWHNKALLIENDDDVCWTDLGASMEALEEVPQRVEIEIKPHFGSDYNLIRKVGNKSFTEPERLLMEQALNGELFTKEDMIIFSDSCWVISKGTDAYSTGELFEKWLQTRKG